MISRLVARFPTLSAALFYAFAVLLAFSKFFAGLSLLPEMSDQRQGFPPRQFAADYFREFGSIPEWSPYIFGGFPFVSNTGFGDTFFPTMLLRLFMPADRGLSLAFMVFIFLAGLFGFLFLRSLKLSWGASLIGGAAYMFTGMVVSLVSPGHDGKLYVSAIMPLALMFLYKGVTRADWKHYFFFGVAVGLALLSPSFQAAYYMLMAAGFFWGFLVFLSNERPATEPWWRSTILFVLALGVGFAVAAIQLMPFLEYLPFSPRGAEGSSSSGWDYAVSWSMPPEELLGTVLPGFNATGPLTADNGLLYYIGRNFFKLHSDYFGIIAVLLALAAFRIEARRRMAWFFVFLAAYAAVFAFGGHTPFYAIPYNILPGISKTRAPSIIFFLASFSVSVLAAFGAEYLLGRAEAVVGAAAKAGKRAAKAAADAVANVPPLQELDKRVLIGFAVFGGLALLAAIGGLRPVMEAFASDGQGVPADAKVDTNYPGFVVHMLTALVLAAAALFLILPSTIRKLGRDAAALALGGVVLLDLYALERNYIRFSPTAAEIMRPDDVVAALKADTTLYRVMPIAAPYMQNYFMAHGIRTALGHNAFELHAYDELLGGKNSWEQSQSHLFSPRLWDILGVRYVVLEGLLPPADSVPEEARHIINALELVADSLQTYEGRRAALYRVKNPLGYAALVQNAVRLQEPGEFRQVVPTIVDQRFDTRGLIILEKGAPAGGDSASFAAPVANAVIASEERPGKLNFTFEKPVESDAFLYVAESYFPSWHARVDGVEAPVLRAQVAMMAVPVKAGARSVSLEYSSSAYHTGRLISLVMLIATIGVAVLALMRRPAREQAAA